MLHSPNLHRGVRLRLRLHHRSTHLRQPRMPSPTPKPIPLYIRQRSLLAIPLFSAALAQPLPPAPQIRRANQAGFSTCPPITSLVQRVQRHHRLHQQARLFSAPQPKLIRRRLLATCKVTHQPRPQFNQRVLIALPIRETCLIFRTRLRRRCSCSATRSLCLPVRDPANQKRRNRQQPE